MIRTRNPKTSMLPIIRITHRDKPERVVTLDQAVTGIGRESLNRIHLLDSEVSRKHAEIRCESPTKYVIVDLDSSNGTLVNGIKTKKRALRPGDQITLGDYTLSFNNGEIKPDSNTPINVVLDPTDEDGSRIVSNYSRGKSQTVDQSNPASQNFRQRQASGGTKQSVPSLEVIYQTSLAIGRPVELNQVLERILQLVFDWVDADRGCIMLREAENSELYPAARRDRATQEDGETIESISISKAIADHVLDQQTGVRTSNAREDQRFETSISIVTRGTREALCVPLQGRYSIVGLLYVDTFTKPDRNRPSEKTPRFNDEQLRIMTAIGYQAAIAIEDTHYYSSLLKAERLTAMGQALASLSHDIKNILQGIRGGSYLIENGLQQDNGDAIRRGWKMVDRNQERISNLVLDMLTFSKDRKPRLKSRDLNELAVEVFEHFAMRAEDLGIDYQLRLSKDPVVCSFDYDSLHRALLNILTNATDAVTDYHQMTEDKQAPEINSTANQAKSVSPMKGLIYLETSQNDEGVCEIRIGDNGAGISPDSHEKIFEFFESTKGASGTGIGLPVSAKIIEEHDGRIEILKPRHGSGTIFQITLPGTSRSAESPQA